MSQPVPTPPFSLDDYPMELVVAQSGDQWAQLVLATADWTLNPYVGGIFNPADQSVASVLNSGRETVVVSGPVQQADCVSYLCVGGPGASTVDITLSPASLVGGVQYLGWTGSTFEPGPAIESDGYYWYRLSVQWAAPYDGTAALIANTARTDQPDLSFTIWAFREDPQAEPEPTGSFYQIYECAQPGPFLRAQLISLTGQGRLRVTYDWLYSALNCDPFDKSTFEWDFVKLSHGQVALSPSQRHDGMTLYASVRPDNNYYVQTQAPGSHQWITSVQADEQLIGEAVEIIGIAFKGVNGSYISINGKPDKHDSHSGYRLRADASTLAEDCVFVMLDTSVLQEDLQYLLGYQLTVPDLQAVMAAYGIPGLSEPELEQLVTETPMITPVLLDSARHRSLNQPRAPIGPSWPPREP